MTITNPKSVIRKLLAQSTIERLRFLLQTLPRLPERAQARRLFLSAPDSPEYLGYEMLETLQNTYPPIIEYGYTKEAVESRGIERAMQLLRLPGSTTSKNFLELGCWDGMVSAALARYGKQTTAVDSRSDGFDERAISRGVALVKADAANLSFPDEMFDFVFSYDAFEHFASPSNVLREAIRVAKPGGYIYLEFGPLYFSAFGEHAYRTIRIPYCQFLFSEETLNIFSEKNHLAPIDFSHVNRWSLADYRNLWRQHSETIKIIRYIEGQNLAHIGLIRRYPSCFKSKSSDFEDFTVSSISVLFQKSASLELEVRRPDAGHSGRTAILQDPR